MFRLVSEGLVRLVHGTYLNLTPKSLSISPLSYMLDVFIHSDRKEEVLWKSLLRFIKKENQKYIP
jgi:hypothetical protein